MSQASGDDVPPRLGIGCAAARAEIVGPQVKYLTPDSTLKLICRVVQSTEASAFIFWYHNNRMINYDLDRGINVSTEAVLCAMEISSPKPPPLTPSTICTFADRTPRPSSVDGSLMLIEMAFPSGVIG
ncbi:AGAP005028-PA-like protein [Anopheles sinensis]|uniref:AGAP005028-PA-like protein n=1 Tax=Anopheles sinensis TaxID=74873 RepID=A0A084WDQ6_ANOSI|nr:AGAP005028-PA-like protein [Anopheles sinensis]